MRFRAPYLLGFFLFLSFFIFVIFSFTTAAAQQEQQKSWEAPAWADTLENPVTGDAEATEAGKKLFQSTCSVCHGKTGKGDGPASKGLKPQPKNLSSEEVQKQSDGAIFWKLTTGNLPMASYKEVYSEEQRWQLVNYIRKLAEKEEKESE